MYGGYMPVMALFPDFESKIFDWRWYLSKATSQTTIRSKFKTNMVSTSRVISIYSGFRLIHGVYMPTMTSFSDSESEIFDCRWYPSKATSQITTMSQFKTNMVSTSRVIVIKIYGGCKLLYGGYMPVMTSFSDSESEFLTVGDINPNQHHRLTPDQSLRRVRLSHPDL